MHYTGKNLSELLKVRSLTVALLQLFSIFHLVIFCDDKDMVELKPDILEMEGFCAMETATTYFLPQPLIPTASNESLNSVASLEEKSLHQQDDSSENSDISSLPKANK